MGPDKNLWFCDYGNAMIGRITRKGAVTEFSLPGVADPHGIAVGKDGNFWITDQSYQEIIAMNVSGTVLATYSADFSPGHDQLQYIVAAPDGNLYFTESSSNPKIKARIGRITTAGKIAFIGRLAADSYPGRLTVGKDKNVYFTENNAQKLGKIETSTGKVSEFVLPFAHDAGTSGLVSGPDGRMWMGGYQTIYAVSY
jgi:virginiamycin B lyase